MCNFLLAPWQLAGNASAWWQYWCWHCQGRKKMKTLQSIQEGETRRKRKRNELKYYAFDARWSNVWVFLFRFFFSGFCVRVGDRASASPGHKGWQRSVCTRCEVIYAARRSEGTKYDFTSASDDGFSAVELCSASLGMPKSLGALRLLSFPWQKGCSSWLNSLVAAAGNWSVSPVIAVCRSPNWPRSRLTSSSIRSEFLSHRNRPSPSSGRDN